MEKFTILESPAILATYKDVEGDMVITVKDEALKAHLKVVLWQYGQAMQYQNKDEDEQNICN